MIFIAHRGNLNGPSKYENKPSYVKTALEAGYDVELDVWIYGLSWYLGHDEARYLVNAAEINNEHVWWHAKNIAALQSMIAMGWHCFWHQDDAHTLTSKGYIWTHCKMGSPEGSICVLPEQGTGKVHPNCAGICTDYPIEFAARWLKETTQDCS